MGLALVGQWRNLTQVVPGPKHLIGAVHDALCINIAVFCCILEYAPWCMHALLSCGLDNLDRKVERCLIGCMNIAKGERGVDGMGRGYLQSGSFRLRHGFLRRDNGAAWHVLDQALPKSILERVYVG